VAKASVWNQNRVVIVGVKVTMYAKYL